MSERTRRLPEPAHFDPEQAGTLRKIDYEGLARSAEAWAREQAIEPAYRDAPRIGMVLIDMQNTFCLPGFELFVAGRSGRGAVDDVARVARFAYRHLPLLTECAASLDTHRPFHVFHAGLLRAADGSPVEPMSIFSAADAREGRIKLDPDAARGLGLDEGAAREHLVHYTSELERKGKNGLLVWPYHSMLGGVGHALAPLVEEALFFHALARRAQPELAIKGVHPLTEHFSVLGPEVDRDAAGRPLVGGKLDLAAKLRDWDAMIVAGEAKSHCVLWTLEDLAAHIEETEPELAGKVYLLDDATSAVVVPGGPDFTEAAEEGYARFAKAGMHRVETTRPLESWPGVIGELAAG